MGQDNSTQQNPITTPDNHTILNNSQWHSYTQTKSNLTNKPGTIFTHKYTSPQSWQETINYLKYIRTLRHPNILKYSSSYTIPNDRIELIISPTISLTQFIPHCSKSNTIQGIRELVSAILFLHDSAKVCHLGISVGEVFIDNFNGCWLLGGFGLARKIVSTVNNEILSLEKFNLLKKQLNEDEAELTNCTSIDVWLFKQFIDDVIEATKYNSLLEDLLDWLDTNWFELQFEDILNHETLNNSVTETIEMLTNISIMDRHAKRKFLESLPSRLNTLDESVLAFRITQLIFSTHLYMEQLVRNNIIPLLLIPKCKKFSKEISGNQEYILNALITEDTYKQFIVPLIIRLFAKQELQLRVILLKYFKYFIYLFSYQQQTLIHSHIILGLRDSREELAKLTFFALGELTSYMGVRGVTGKEVRPIFTDVRPRDYQLTVSNNDVIDNNINHMDVMQPIEQNSANTANVQISCENELSDFFENETKQQENIECYNIENLNEADLLSELRKPKFHLGKRENNFPEPETDELLLVTDDSHKQTLLELSQLNSLPNNPIENGIDNLTDIELDSNTDNGKPEIAWEDWDPF
ncbi:Protein-associating with the carboxyl-terminal domain of ezrin [Oopsacas minuta]|uniref:Protein-associating with the carboxyl-terminal domain of ezrin n=1 Tax=Oopsacas minuta TaxID=111878 RepID=A0AAV7JKC3_9METZ|nr:Protein-associating with the carboxyl-terminal domain of ezrin [Oopsacas minuta]